MRKDDGTWLTAKSLTQETNVARVLYTTFCFMPYCVHASIRCSQSWRAKNAFSLRSSLSSARYRWLSSFTHRRMPWGSRQIWSAWSVYPVISNEQRQQYILITEYCSTGRNEKTYREMAHLPYNPNTDTCIVKKKIKKTPRSEPDSVIKREYNEQHSILIYSFAKCIPSILIT